MVQMQTEMFYLYIIHSWKLNKFINKNVVKPFFFLWSKIKWYTLACAHRRHLTQQLVIRLKFNWKQKKTIFSKQKIYIYVLDVFRRIHKIALTQWTCWCHLRTCVHFPNHFQVALSTWTQTNGHLDNNLTKSTLT